VCRADTTPAFGYGASCNFPEDEAPFSNMVIDASRQAKGGFFSRRGSSNRRRPSELSQSPDIQALSQIPKMPAPAGQDFDIQALLLQTSQTLVPIEQDFSTQALTPQIPVPIHCISATTYDLPTLSTPPKQSKHWRTNWFSSKAEQQTVNQQN
jgi:hypothetical protein